MQRFESARRLQQDPFVLQLPPFSFRCMPGTTQGVAASHSSRMIPLLLFDKNAASAREIISSTTDEHLGKPWTLLHGGKPVLTLPRFAVLRSFVFNHSVHHRAQLGVYLRLNNLPVPSIYGPSADEGAM
jgi:hypothetical protein